jgi:hypothetical protein
MTKRWAMMNMIGTGMTIAALEDADGLVTDDGMPKDADELASDRVGVLVVVSVDEARS